MFTRSFPRVKRLGLSVDHPPSSSAEVKERVELYLYSSSWTSWSVLRWPSLFRIVFLALIWTRNFYILGTEIWHFNLFDKRMYSWNTEVRLQVVKDEERWEAYYQQGQRLICCPNWTHPPPPSTTFYPVVTGSCFLVGKESGALTVYLFPLFPRLRLWGAALQYPPCAFFSY